MPTFNHPRQDADAAREALRQLAHSTRALDNPSDLYDVLGSLTGALVATEQVLHQLGKFHDAHGADRHTPRASRGAFFQEAWELHRAAEMVRQISITVDRAHQLEADMTYLPIPEPRGTSSVPASPGLSL